MAGKRLRLGWFSSGRDEAARQLLTTVASAIEEGRLNASLEFCFVNREPGEGEESDRFLDLVREEEIPLVTLSDQPFRAASRQGGELNPSAEWRVSFDQAVADRLAGFSCDLVVLSGYMLIVSPVLFNRFPMINLHPALPEGPVGTWQQVIETVMKEAHDETGAMVHLVTGELDRGPVVAYTSFKTKTGALAPLWAGDDRDDLFEKIREIGAARELPLVFLTLEKMAGGELEISGGKVLWRGREAKGGICLDDEVELFVDETAAPPPGC